VDAGVVGWAGVGAGVRGWEVRGASSRDDFRLGSSEGEAEAPCQQSLRRSLAVGAHTLAIGS
jgi:hypothetical protein